jgi:hypothetical protein
LASGSLPGVFDVETRPLTGNVLIAHFSALDELGAAARTAGLALWRISGEKVVPPALTLLWYASNLGGLWRHDGMTDGE